MNGKSVKAAFIASAVCAMFATAATAADKAAGHDKAGGEVKCAGCGGQNGCKGQGWVPTKTEKECTDKGGKIVTAKK